MAKAIDLIVVAIAVVAVPTVGIFAGVIYLLIGDGLFDACSPGKKVMKLRVISTATGANGNFRESIIRNIPFAAAVLLFGIPFVGWVFSLLILIFEFLLMLGNPEGMRIGDDLANTKVIEG